ncbi:MAG: ABC transporter permease [Bacteroidales bacterium]|nr:ABC transporter permease [Bacteroidales bacterium]
MLQTIKQVLSREIRRIVSRPVYLVASIGTMTLIYVFFLTFMHEGLPQQLPVGVVDMDNSSISRRLARELDATQNVQVVAKYSSFAEARDAMQRGKIYAFFLVPENCYSDILAFKRPTISYYINQGYLLGGSLSMKSMLTLANLASPAVQRELLRAKGFNDEAIMGLIQPIVVDTHYIGNPETNYPVYLLTTIFPGMLGVIILLLTTYSIGVEMKKKTSHGWLKAADHSLGIALIGKLLPYTILYFFLELAGIATMYLILGFPMNGSLAYYILAVLLYIVSMQAVGVFIVGLAPVCRYAVCYATLYGILAITMSGFTYPVDAMYPALQALSWIFPIRQLFLLGTDVALLGSGFAETWMRVVIMMLFILLPCTIWSRLKGALIYQNYTQK